MGRAVGLTATLLGIGHRSGNHGECHYKSRDGLQYLLHSYFCFLDNLLSS